MEPKEVFRKAIQGKNRGKPPFVAFANGLAARTASIDVQQMVLDPGFYASALEGLFALLGGGALTVNFDVSMEMGDLGAEVQWPSEYGTAVVQPADKAAVIEPDTFVLQTRTATVIETVNRLTLSVGREKAVACALLGPCTFIHSLKSTFKDLGTVETKELIQKYGTHITKLVRTLCEQKVDALFFREDLLGKQFMDLFSENQAAFKSLYTTLFNIVQAFNAFPVITTNQLAIEAIQPLYEAIKPNGIVLFGFTADQAALNTLLESVKGLKLSLGLPLPTTTASSEALSDTFERLESFRIENGLRNIFYCSDGEIPHDIDLGILLAFIEKMNGD